MRAAIEKGEVDENDEVQITKIRKSVPQVNRTITNNHNIRFALTIIIYFRYRRLRYLHTIVMKRYHCSRDMKKG